MVDRALDAGVPCAWVTGDEVYGQDSALRAELERRGQPYVLAVRRTATPRVATGAGVRPVAVTALADALGETDWSRLSAGDGAKGHAGTIVAVSSWRSRARPALVSGCWCAAA